MGNGASSITFYTPKYWLGKIGKWFFTIKIFTTFSHNFRCHLLSGFLFVIFLISIFQNHLEDDTSCYKRKLSKFSNQNIHKIKRIMIFLTHKPHSPYSTPSHTAFHVSQTHPTQTTIQLTKQSNVPQNGYGEIR